MQHPRTLVVGLKADSSIITSHAYANDITSNRVHEIIGRTPRTSNNSEIVLKSSKAGLVYTVLRYRIQYGLPREGG
jgi:hypothetical protein